MSAAVAERNLLTLGGFIMNTAFVRRFTFLVIVVSVALVGCGGGGIERVDVSGAVTYQGEPVKEGLISFVPQGDDTAWIR